MSQKLLFNAKAVPLVLLLLSWVSFGPLIHRLGFYWDDWPSIWFLHVLGPPGFQQGFASDRPLLAWVFMLTTSLLGESMLVWQVFGILTRWLTSLALFWALIGLWPARLQQVTWIAMLMAVYPGFSQHYISVTYSNAFLVYSVFIFSFGAMIWAFRWPRWLWPLTVLSWVSLALSVFISEYFFGLELLRPFILWLLLADRTTNLGKRLKRVVLYWLPYALVLALFVVWRLFVHQSPRARIVIFDQLRASPLRSILNLGLTIVQDLFEVTVLAWARVFKARDLLDFDLVVVLIFLGLMLLAGVLTFFFLGKLEGKKPQRDSEQGSSKAWALQALLLGALALLLGGWPIWVTNLHIELIFPWDRLTMPMMIGTSILLAGLVEFINRPRLPGAFVLSVLVGLAVGINFQNALTFRQDWLVQKSFFWQLVWRAPGIEPGTALMTSELPFRYYSDNSLTAPLIWTYAPEYTSGKMPYVVYNLESRLGIGISSLEPGVPIQQPYRATSFTGSTDQVIVLFHAPPRCLKVMHPEDDRNLPYKPRNIPDALPLSKPDLILENAHPPAAPPASFFDPEPEHDWCYYFEKAELARQTNDWQGIVSLGEQAFKLDKEFTRETASELAPFVVGYARAGYWEKAVELSLQAYRAAEKTKNMLCQAWYNLRETTPADPDREAALAQIENNIQCNFP